ncbi:HIT domain-containing protein [Halosegnis rubeus]|jgi:histidine triad (HIT) family protein|uniref:HIT domain-containing protein n=1 Tax=Halosegnis rubeus TaxID=2212850 RepID=A0A5N5UFN7_9EURY|nr:HIT family protein [Halosegnis rubeus]KAB7515439.1 HIT domain-containing protein [Halosegnis rubeus]KAB7516491.1 HIT domain-containing protein [Halosegnis rubeus]
MSDDCIFCQIIDGDIPARTVYETDETLAFLDANPLAEGHTLVIPKTHARQLQDLDDETATAVYETLHRLVPVVEGTVGADGSNVAFNNGPAAGQEIPHVHGHIIPRFEGDGGRPVHAVAGSPPELSEEDLDTIAGEIKSNA